MWFGVLGPLEVRDPQGEVVRIAGPARRQVLAALLCRAGRTVPAHVLIEDLWGDSPPRTAAKTLQSHIVRLREDLARAAPSLLQTDSSGYRLLVTADELDASVFERRVHEALDRETAESEASIGQLDRALAMWRGEAYQDFTEGAFAIAERVRLTELRSLAQELRTDLALGAGRTSDLLPGLERRVAAEPYRERGWQQLAIALYRSGRQPDALTALRKASRLLVDDLGVDASPALQELESQILRHDGALGRPGVRHTLPSAAVTLHDGTTTCPYRGLAGFGERDASVFVGRERLTATIVAALGERSVCLLVGASGSGKSSLVQAGVLPTLRSGALPGSTSWRVEVRTPSAWVSVPDDVELLVLDQAEELFSVIPEVDRNTVIAELEQHVSAGRRLLLLLRGDFFGRLTEVSALARWSQQSTILVGPMRDDEIRRAIVEPAALSGLVVDDDLTDSILDEMKGQPEALPMLSAALVATWENREGNLLTTVGYRRGGGVGGAIEASADRVYQGLDRGLQDQARQLLVRLAQQDAGIWVRRPMALAEASTYADPRVLQALVEGRLVSADQTRVQLSHESLLDRWPKLRDWLDDRAVAADMLDHVRGSAHAWHLAGNPASDLYRGVRLQAAQEWQAQHPIEITPLESDFLAASATAAEHELAQANARAESEAAGRRRVRRAAVALAVVVVLAVAGAVIAVVEGHTARAQRRAADRSALAADARKLAAQALSAPDLRTSLLLSAAAYRLQDSTDSRAALLTGLERSGAALWRLPTENRVQWLGASADGTRLWAADNRQVVTRFDAATHRPLGTYPLRASSVGDLSPDSSMIVAVGASGFDDAAGVSRGLVLDAATGAVKTVLSVPVVDASSGTRTAAFTGDGHWLVVEVGETGMPGRHTNKIAVFDATNLATPPRIFTASDRVMAVGVGDKTFAVRTERGELDLVDPSTMSTLKHGRQPGLAVSDQRDDDGRPPLALSPDGKRLAFMGIQRASLPLLLNTDALSASPEPADDLGTDVNEMAFSPSGELLAAGGSSGIIDLIHASDGTEALRLSGNSGQVMGLAWPRTQPNGLFAAGLDSQIVSYDTSLTSRVLAPSGPTVPRANDMTPYGDMLLGLRPAEGDAPESKVAMFVEDRETGRTRISFALGLRDDDYVTAFAPDDAHHTVLVTIQHADNTIGCRLFDLATGRPIVDFAPTTKASPHQAFSATLSPDGKTIVASIADRTLAVIDVVTKKTLRTVEVQFSGTGANRTLAEPIAFGPDGRLLVMGVDPGAAPLPPPGSNGLASAPDGSAEDSRAVMVDLATGNTSPEIRLGSLGVFAAWDWSPDGRWLAIGTLSGRLVVADAHTLKQSGDHVSAAAGFVVAVRYSPDGRTIVTSGTDGMINLWDAATLQRIGLPLDAHSLKAWWTPSGDLFGYQFIDGPTSQQRRYTMPGRAEQWTVLACAIAGSDLTAAEWARYVGDRPYRKACA